MASATTPLWQVGSDHAGIPTRRLVVERKLAGKKAENPPRSWAVKSSFKRILGMGRKNLAAPLPTQICAGWGNSVDWDTERFTHGRRFLQGPCRKCLSACTKTAWSIWQKRLVDWDPKLHTADFRSGSGKQRKTSGFFLAPAAIRLADGATTQDGKVTWLLPLPAGNHAGDTAVAVHPDDERYQHWIGTVSYATACVNRRIPSGLPEPPR